MYHSLLKKALFDTALNDTALFDTALVFACAGVYFNHITLV